MIKGRTAEKWGRDKSGRWDPGPTNRTTFYPHVEYTEPACSEPLVATLPGRPGYAEREVDLDYLPNELTIGLDGWFYEEVTLNDRQATFLRDTLNQWFPEPSP